MYSCVLVSVGMMGMYRCVPVPECAGICRNVLACTGMCQHDPAWMCSRVWWYVPDCSCMHLGVRGVGMWWCLLVFAGIYDLWCNLIECHAKWIQMECNVCKLCVRLIVCLSVRPSVCLSVRLSVCPSVCLSVCVYVTGCLPACAHVVCMLVCCMYNLYQKSSMNVHIQHVPL